MEIQSVSFDSSIDHQPNVELSSDLRVHPVLPKTKAKRASKVSNTKLESDKNEASEKMDVPLDASVEPKAKAKRAPRVKKDVKSSELENQTNFVQESHLENLTAKKQNDNPNLNDKDCLLSSEPQPSPKPKRKSTTKKTVLAVPFLDSEVLVEAIPPIAENKPKAKRTIQKKTTSLTNASTELTVQTNLSLPSVLDDELIEFTEGNKAIEEPEKISTENFKDGTERKSDILTDTKQLQPLISDRSSLIELACQSSINKNIELSPSVENDREQSSLRSHQSAESTLLPLLKPAKIIETSTVNESLAYIPDVPRPARRRLNLHAPSTTSSQQFSTLSVNSSINKPANNHANSRGSQLRLLSFMVGEDREETKKTLSTAEYASSIECDGVSSPSFMWDSSSTSATANVRMKMATDASLFTVLVLSVTCCGVLVPVSALHAVACKVTCLPRTFAFVPLDPSWAASEEAGALLIAGEIPAMELFSSLGLEVVMIKTLPLYEVPLSEIKLLVEGMFEWTVNSGNERVFCKLACQSDLSSKSQFIPFDALHAIDTHARKVSNVNNMNSSKLKRNRLLTPLLGFSIQNLDWDIDTSVKGRAEAIDGEVCLLVEVYFHTVVTHIASPLARQLPREATLVPQLKTVIVTKFTEQEDDKEPTALVFPPFVSEGDDCEPSCVPSYLLLTSTPIHLPKLTSSILVKWIVQFIIAPLFKFSIDQGKFECRIQDLSIQSKKKVQNQKQINYTEFNLGLSKSRTVFGGIQMWADAANLEFASKHTSNEIIEYIDLKTCGSLLELPANIRRVLRYLNPTCKHVKQVSQCVAMGSLKMRFNGRARHNHPGFMSGDFPFILD